MNIQATDFHWCLTTDLKDHQRNMGKSMELASLPLPPEVSRNLIVIVPALWLFLKGIVKSLFRIINPFFYTYRKKCLMTQNKLFSMKFILIFYHYPRATQQLKSAAFWIAIMHDHQKSWNILKPSDFSDRISGRLNFLQIKESDDFGILYDWWRVKTSQWNPIKSH